jgi:hypothetical protein
MSEVKQYKQRIEEMLKKAPPSVVNGSYQMAANFKAAAAAAKKAANQNNLSALTTACSRLESFYK